MSLNAPDWLTARPIAHRGLHDRAKNILENTTAAALAAIAGNYAIECDVQRTKDGKAVVFHDFTLKRLTSSTGRVDAFTAAELAGVNYSIGTGTIPSLSEFMELISGRVPLIIEIKSHFDGDMRLADRVAEVVAESSAPIALKSFDPDIMAHLRTKALTCPLGIVAEAAYTHEEYKHLSDRQRLSLTHFLHYERTRPDFLSWGVNDFPHSTPHLLRKGLKMPVMTWTVRTKQQRELAAAWADQMVFEGFLP